MKTIKINEFTYLKKSKIHNNGIFALNQFKETKIIEYTGELISTEEDRRCELSQAKHKKIKKWINLCYDY